jgi:hypothetical protein
MELELVNKNLLALAVKEPGDDTSTMWWVTLKMLRKMGFSADLMGKGIAIFMRGDGVIVRDNDARIETFLYDARNVRVISVQRDALSNYAPHRGALAFSVEVYADRRSYTPLYGFVPRNQDPVELARNHFFLLQELAREYNLAILQGRLALPGTKSDGVLEAKRLVR